jgi:steroid delta-isomerase-like uncharacterized protein
MGEAAHAAEDFLAAFNAHDAARIRDGYSEDVVFQAPGVELEGSEAATEYAMTYIRAFPDVRLTATNVVEAGEWVAIEFDYEGTHEGPLATPDGEIPPTGRRAAGRGVDIVRVEAGKVIEERLYFDQLTFLAQLGLVPEPAAAG